MKLIDNIPLLIDAACRSPCGERGLKLLHRRRSRDGSPSLPVRGAWIEIVTRRGRIRKVRKSLPVRGAWIEIRGGTDRRKDR